jgi:hypothetical protein
MPTRHQLTSVARKLKTHLNGKAFLTIPRMEITELVRTESGEDSTRIKSSMASELQMALLEQGVRCYPPLDGTTTGDTVRLFHAGTVLGNLVDILIHPSTESDRDLGGMLTKIKGKWAWSTGCDTHTV